MRLLTLEGARLDDVGFSNGRREFLPPVVWASVSLFGLAIVGLIVGAPFAQAHGHPEIAAPIYKAFGLVCHQIPERSFHLSGHLFGVCSRCTGL